MGENDDDFAEYKEWLTNSGEYEQVVSDPVAEYAPSIETAPVKVDKQLLRRPAPIVPESDVRKWLDRPFKYSSRRCSDYYWKLGAAGEEKVIEFERQRLLDANRPNLARRVRKSLGEEECFYDIISYDLNGDEIFIEVKTTDEDNAFPFIVTEKQIAESQKLGGKYLLYRLYNFSTAPEFYVLTGPLSANSRTEKKEHWGWPLASQEPRFNL